MENIQLYTLIDDVLNDWSEVTKSLLETGMLLIVFEKVPLRVMVVLGVTRLQSPTTQVIAVDETGNGFTQKLESSPGFAMALYSFHHGAVRFFEGFRVGD